MVTRPAAGHGVARVDHEVHDDLLELTGVREHAARPSLRDDRELDVLPNQPPEHRLEALDDAREVEHARLEHLLAAEREELAGQRWPRARRASSTSVEVAARGIVRLADVEEQRVAVARDDGEEVVEVVGDAAGEPADRLHLLRLPELLLQMRVRVRGGAAIADVAGDAEDPDRRPVAVASDEPTSGSRSTSSSRPCTSPRAR